MQSIWAEGVILKAISIVGGNFLCGETKIQGSKNGVLPILAATVLIHGRTRIENCPNISDVTHMLKILAYIGCKVEQKKSVVIIDAKNIHTTVLPTKYVTRMRSSIVLLGAILGRMGQVTISYPGGCVIGERPIDIHKKSIEKMGAVFVEEEDTLYAQGKNLVGTKILLPVASVGATENIILAAVRATGTTEIVNCAREPEIVSLCRFLQRAGAKIEGVGSCHLFIEGVKKLQELEYTIDADRIVAGTYLLAGVATGGDIFLRNAPSDQLQVVIRHAEQMGASVVVDERGLRIVRKGNLNTIPFIETREYPEFPTDLQSPMVTTLLCAKGKSEVKENIFSNRFGFIEELNKMHANIEVFENEAIISGRQELLGKTVFAADLRGGAALILAGLVARGTTEIRNIHFIERGYQDIVADLQCLGAKISRTG